MTRIADPSFRLRDHYTPPSLPIAPEVGPGLDGVSRPMLRLADYIHRQLADPPAAISRPPGLETGGGAARTTVAWVAVSPGNLNECRIAIDEFGELHIGIALPVTAQGQKEWAVVGNPSTDPDSKPGSWGGHGVPYREYDAETFKCVTWGVEMLVSVPFHTNYARKAHVVVTHELLSKEGIGPGGVNWDELIADIKALPRQQDKGDPVGAPQRKLA